MSGKNSRLDNLEQLIFDLYQFVGWCQIREAQPDGYSSEDIESLMDRLRVWLVVDSDD